MSGLVNGRGDEEEEMEVEEGMVVVGSRGGVTIVVFLVDVIVSALVVLL